MGVGAFVGLCVGRVVVVVGAFVGAGVVGAFVGARVVGARVGTGDDDGSAVMDGAKLGLSETTCCSTKARLGAGEEEPVGATGAKTVGVIGTS